MPSTVSPYLLQSGVAQVRGEKVVITLQLAMVHLSREGFKSDLLPYKRHKPVGCARTSTQIFPEYPWDDFLPFPIVYHLGREGEILCPFHMAKFVFDILTIANRTL